MIKPSRNKMIDIVLRVGPLTLLNPDKITSGNSICNIYCDEHGYCEAFGNSFFPRYYKYLKKFKGCPKCTGKYRKTSEEYVDELRNQMHPDLTLIKSGKFDGKETEAYVKCIEHEYCWEFGTPWIPKYRTLRNGNPCIKCTGTYHPTESEIVGNISNVLPSKLRLIGINSYQNQNSTCLVECEDHGKMWLWEEPSCPSVHILQNYPKCLKCDKNEMIEEVNYNLRKCDKQPHLTVLDIQGEVSSISACIVDCPDHGRLDHFSNPVFPTVDSLKRVHFVKNRNGCPKCGGNYRYSEVEYRIAIRLHLNRVNPLLSLVSINDFKNNASKCVLRCQEHGLLNEFETPCLPIISKVLMFKQRCGCPKCSNKYHKTAEEVLQEYGISSGFEVYIRGFDDPLGYVGLDTRCLVTCVECGDCDAFDNPHIPTLESFKNSLECPKCNNSYLRSKDENIHKLNRESRGLYLVHDIPDFQNLESRVLVECCFHGISPQWNPTTRNLLRGDGCRQCFNEGHNLLSIAKHPHQAKRSRKLYFARITVLATGEVFYKIGLRNNPLNVRYGKGKLQKDGITIDELAEYTEENLNVSLGEFFAMFKYSAYRINREHIMKHCKGGTECFNMNLLEFTSLENLVRDALIEKPKLMELVKRFNRYER